MAAEHLDPPMAKMYTFKCSDQFAYGHAQARGDLTQAGDDRCFHMSYYACIDDHMTT